MCGIAGFVGISDRQLLKKMCNIIQHRGPDESGFFIDDNVGLGNQRLSIIDVAEGHMPMQNEDKTITITYNGEIYNYLELKKELEEKGHRFSTRSDTEAIIHAYEEYGDSCVEKLRGMFAIALWDTKKKSLFLARDRFGKKPLYYTYVNGVFLFGSEIKSILLHAGVKRQLNYEALDKYLTFRYVPGSITMFKNIYKLPPGHILNYSNGKAKIRKYWSLSLDKFDNMSEQYYSEKLFEMLKEAVKIRLMSEVPLGAYLSGGIDSSSIVGIMSTLVEEPVKTFSVGFTGYGEVDELSHAQLVADHFNTDHRHFYVEANTSKLLPQIVWHFDEPNADPAAIPVYLLSEMTKKFATVVLVGEGGDEMFAGYQWYKIMSLGKKVSLTPKFMRSVIPAVIKNTPKWLLNMIFEYTSALGEEGMKRFEQFISLLDNESDAFLLMISIFTEDEKKELYNDDLLKQKFTPANETVKSYFENNNVPTLNKMLLYDSNNWLQHLLMKTDKMTMSKSIEARVPFLDHVFAEFVARIPPGLKLRGKTDKYILRKSMSRLIPKEIMKRKKHQFFVPIDAWFEGELRDVVLQILSESNVEKGKCFRYDYIKKIIERHGSSKLYYSRQLWNLLIFEMWHKTFIENDHVSKPLVLDKMI